jgi:YVTN family beta-propeller protein
MRLGIACAAIALLLAAARASGASYEVLPNGWVLLSPADAVTQTGTMPQGAALSPDGAAFAVVESGFNPPALRIYSLPSLRLRERIALAGAFGRPVWTDRGILVAGANADAVFLVDPNGGAVRKIALHHGSYPVAVARHGDAIAVATEGDDSVRVADLEHLARARAIRVGHQLGEIAFSSDGTKLFVAVRSSNTVAVVTAANRELRRIRTKLHPGALLVAGNALYVAESDADSVGAYDVATGRRLATIAVGTVPGVIGSSPNALAMQNGTLYVSLGSANTIAAVRSGRVVARYPAGWYPTGVVAYRDRLYIIDGKGEGTKPNLGFNVMSRDFHDYVAAIQYGSIRTIDLRAQTQPNPQGAQGFDAAVPAGTIVRKDGPIKHVLFILKENRSYDQILGDLAQGNGDPKLVYFGRPVTPNQHAIAERFGLFDNFYSSGEVSDPGHNWADGAFANDYVERMWPPAYGDRNDNDETLTGVGAGVPAAGYIWDAARRAGVTFRDYGEMALMPAVDGHPTSTAPSLGDRYDPHYVGWNLGYSDLDRVKEWKREFERFLAKDRVPQLEWMWLPNDHTAGTRAGALTPSAYIATNDYAVGEIVDAISHSKIWPSTAIFVIEDDAQDGADHVSDQRTTAYVVSPYAAGGVMHEQYSTLSMLRTIELMLGMQPLSAYDATAVPLYAAFDATPHLAPFNVMPYEVDIRARNAKIAYGERVSERLDLRMPDRAPPGVLADILAHAQTGR